MTRPKKDRLHDLNTICYDFKTVLSLLKSGYKFDDSDAAPVLDQLEKAVKMLQTEIEIFKSEDN